VKTLLLAAARHIGGSIKAFDGHPQRVRRHVAAGYVNRTVKSGCCADSKSRRYVALTLTRAATVPPITIPSSTGRASLRSHVEQTGM